MTFKDKQEKQCTACGEPAWSGYWKGLGDPRELTYWKVLLLVTLIPSVLIVLAFVFAFPD